VILYGVLGADGKEASARIEGPKTSLIWVIERLERPCWRACTG
jgi:hypothetical protein